MTSYKPYYKRYLPHIQPAGATFFITTMLHGAIPKQKALDLKEKYKLNISQADLIKSEKERNTNKFNLRKIYIDEIDTLLHEIEGGPEYFKNPNIANLLSEKIHEFDGSLYNLIAYTIMSNHVHLLIDTSIQLRSVDPSNDVPNSYLNLDKIMQRIKGGSSREINKLLNRTGKLWESESYDIVIRNEIMYQNVISYILNNPVKAGLVKNPEDYPFNYVKEFE